MKILLILLLVSGTEQALAQRTKFGVSAGLVRSFVYPQGFSTKGRNDFVHAEGRLGYMLGLNAELPLESKTALNADLRFLRTDTFYDVVAVVPTSFQVAYTWQAERFSYRLSVGLSRVLLERGDKQFRVFGGFLAGVERQRLQFDNAAVSFYDGPVSNLSVAFDYTAPNPTVWSAGPEAGVGLRLYKGVDFNLRYNYNFTPTAPIRYASTLTYNGPAGSPRQTTGTVKGRPVFAAAELVVWFR